MFDKRFLTSSILLLLTLIGATGPLALRTVAYQGNDSATPADSASVKQESRALAQGLVVDVPLPLVGDEDERLISQLRAISSQPKESTLRPVVILHFKSVKTSAAQDSQASDSTAELKPIGKGTQFERALSLARFLASADAANIKTVAYSQASIEGHALLPLLACEQIVLGNNAAMGSIQPGEALNDETVITSYKQIVRRRRSIPEAFLDAMINPAAGVYRMDTVKGDFQFVGEDLRQVMLRNGETWNETEIVKPTKLLRITAVQLKELKLIPGTADSMADLVDLLQLAGLPQDAAMPLGDLQGVLVNVEGRINLRRVATLIRGIEKEIESGTNVLVVRINSEGGAPAASLQLAGFLATLDPTKVIVIGWIDGIARGDAAWILAGCRQRWLSSTSFWGGGGEATIGEAEISNATLPLEELSKKSKIDLPTLIALAAPKIPIALYRHKLDGRQERFTEETLRSKLDREQWELSLQLDWSGGISSEEAFKQGLSQGSANTAEETLKTFQIDQPLRTMQLPWLEMQVQRMANSGFLKMLLLLIAVSCLFSELGSPGLGVSGFLSLVAFGAFFWLQMFNGTLAWLEIFLFIGGVICLVTEFAVLPGFGVFGIGGIAMIGCSVVLASQSFVLPTNTYQLDRFAWNILGLAVLTAGVLMSAFLFRNEIERFLVRRQIALQPGGIDDLNELERKEAMVDWSHLLHQKGTTVTRLSPAGKARFGDELISVMSDGELIASDTPVKVISVLGNHVTVAAI